MKHRELIVAAIAVAVCTSSAAARADNCIAWIKQANGSYWQSCVANDGKRYCWLCPANHRSYADCSKISAGHPPTCP
jgi:hypothetical protein